MATAHIPQYRTNLPDAEPWVRHLGQVGLVAKGVVYVLVGVLTIMAAVRAGTQATDTQGALRFIYEQPFGQALLILLGLGMIAYTVFRFVGAYEDIDAHGRDGKGYAKRSIFALAALPYLALGITAIGIVIGYNVQNDAGSSQSGQSQQQAAAVLMDQPAGIWLVAILGVVFIAWGIWQVYKGAAEKFLRKVKTVGLSPKQFRTLRTSGKAGYIARGIVMAIIGGFFVQAAITHNPDQAGGLAEAFNTLVAQPYGWILLAIVALGFALFGIYNLMLARYRHFAKPA